MITDGPWLHIDIYVLIILFLFRVIGLYLSIVLVISVIPSIVYLSSLLGLCTLCIWFDNLWNACTNSLFNVIIIKLAWMTVQFKHYWCKRFTLRDKFLNNLHKPIKLYIDNISSALCLSSPPSFPPYILSSSPSFRPSVFTFFPPSVCLYLLLCLFLPPFLGVIVSK